MADAICPVCGKKHNDQKNYRIKRPNYCFNCNFWMDKVDEKDKLLIVGGWVYGDGGNSPNGKYLGFGGRVFRYRRLGETEWTETNNMWSGGQIPNHFKDRLPDNAEFENVKVVTFPEGSMYTAAWDIT